MKHKDLLNTARANGMIVATSPVLDREMERLEKMGDEFIPDIKSGKLKLKDVTSWLRAGRSKQLSAWEAEEVAQYIESECR